MSNHLSQERSAYLRQHAGDPVDWYPWCPEAFEKARREEKPVFLSIGYSTCHWCHVMERESFSDPRVAEILNRYYVSVKVDREERPDVDAVYMDACVAVNISGGWPLTVIMSPEKKPFFTGTYMPRENRDGQPGLLQLLSVTASKWKTDRAALESGAEDLVAFLRKEERSERSMDDGQLLARCVKMLKLDHDEEYGGFGRKQKFPRPQALLFLLRYAHYTGEREAREIAEHALRQMARGGIYDQIGGGFSRYSTDREWLRPHFEKTLCDNAMLALCYTEAWEEGRFALYRRIAQETLDYCLRELRSSLGGFYSGQDADSEGEEGKYYLFRPDEVKTVLGEDEGRHFCECYDISPEGNCPGGSIPNLLLNQRWNLLPEGYDAYREQLREYRKQRFPLATDRKLLTAWNVMLLMALSRAARDFKEPRYRQAAEELSRFLRGTAGAEESTTLKALCYEEQGEKNFPALLEDYVFAALGFLEQYELDYDPRLLLLAEGLAKEIQARFTDPRGGFFRSGDGAEELIFRPKDRIEGAGPSGNAGAALLFEQLWKLSAEPRWQEAALAQIGYLAEKTEGVPIANCTAWLALMMERYPGRELVCAAPEPTALLRETRRRYAPELTILLKRPGDRLLESFAPYTAACGMIDGKPAYYPCSGGSCSLPFTQDDP